MLSAVDVTITLLNAADTFYRPKSKSYRLKKQELSQEIKKSKMYSVFALGCLQIAVCMTGTGIYGNNTPDLQFIEQTYGDIYSMENVLLMIEPAIHNGYIMLADNLIDNVVGVPFVGCHILFFFVCACVFCFPYFVTDCVIFFTDAFLTIFLPLIKYHLFQLKIKARN